MIVTTPTNPDFDANKNEVDDCNDDVVVDDDNGDNDWWWCWLWLWNNDVNDDNRDQI